MTEQQKQLFDRFLLFLDQSGVLPYVTVVGSWAEHIYSETNLLGSFLTGAETQDIDFLIKNLKKPTEKLKLINLAAREGYQTLTDWMTGTTKFLIGESLEVEFLVSQMGSGKDYYLKSNLGITVQALRHFDIIQQNIIPVVYMGMTVTVPSPEAYVVHKMVIHQDRGSKQENDRDSIIALWPYLDMKKVKQIALSLSVKELNRFNQFRETYKGELSHFERLLSRERQERVLNNPEPKL